MRYAIKDGLTTIIGAADTLIEFDELINQLDVNLNPPEKTGIVNAEVPSVLELMMEDKYEGFKRSPLIVTHKDEESSDLFNDRYGIICIKRNALLQKHENMLDAAISESDTEDGAAALTIEEMYGLTEDDPWDQRSAEEIEQDEQMKKLYDEAKKKGELSGDSFSPTKKKSKSGVYVTDVHTHTDSDGELHIDKALVVQKGGSKKKQTIFIEAEEADNDDNVEIDTSGPIAIYYRMDVTASKISEIRPILEDAGSTFVVARNIAAGCWFAFITQHQAEKAGKVLTDLGHVIDIYAVNDAGERLIAKGAKGVELIDPNAAADEIELPRPWNERSKEIALMTKAEKEANWKTVKPDEFYISGTYTIATGTVVQITPKSYFNRKNRFWGKPLNINHLLPDDLKEVSPGTYVSKSRDWNHVSYAMARLGYSENMMLQVYLNNL